MRSVYCLAVRRCTVEEPPASFQPVPIHEITEAPRPSPVECCLTPVDDRSRFRDVDDHAVQVWLPAAYSQIFHCFCRAMLCISAAVVRCPSVTLVYSVETNKDILKIVHCRVATAF